MKTSPRTFVAIALLALALKSGAAIAYIFQDLHDLAYVQSFAESGDTAPVGFVHNLNLGTDERAVIWNGSGNSYTSLHPASGFDWTRAEAAAGNRQFGLGEGFATGGLEHALQWSGSAATVLDLHPAQFAVSRIIGARGTQQVGIASFDPGGFLQGNRGNNRAVLWNDGAGAVDLHPAGHVYSEAFDCDGNFQVGVVDDHATLWHGSAASYVTLEKPGTYYSEAHGILEDMQVGYANVGPSPLNSSSHAMVWFGSAESATDIHPASFVQSRAFAVSDAAIAGVASGSNPFDLHAVAWLGLDREFVDLSAVLGSNYTESWAVGLNDAGNIYGFARYVPTNKVHAVEWSPVPEPNSALLLAFGAVAAMARRKASTTENGAKHRRGMLEAPRTAGASS